ncbi:MAG: hypothetical protein LUE86_12520, partial [Clostridiales bacterium]|nr:hypothetical protein [Clostridiales bacterium]
TVTDCDWANYTLEDVDIVNDEGEWSSGDIPKIEITLEADDDYKFDSMTKSKVKLRGDDATYVSSKRQDSSTTLIITVKLDALEGTMDIDDVNWETESSTVAVWEETDGAKSYQVKLYRDSSSVGSTVTTSNTYYNFASLITREGDYYFKVRGVSSNSKKGEWFESDYLYVDEEMLEKINAGYYSQVSNDTSSSSTSTTTTTTPTTTVASDHWVWDTTAQKWWYSYASGGYPAGGWLEINGSWYCFDSSGWMMTGWILAGGNYYYCDTSTGAMLTNTTTPDGYRVGSDGVWIQ